MFTGIIEETGKVTEFCRLNTGAKLKISCKLVIEDTKIGDSISINGCCQTVVNLGTDWFEADVSEETLKVTTFDKLKTGEIVNLERALTPQSRMGGHIVQGHIDCTGKILNIQKIDNFYNFQIEVSKDVTKYIVKKGSITVNGISLTVVECETDSFTVAVIPHTYQNTNLKYLVSGSAVNIETDVLGRYVEKFLSLSNNKNRIDENFLIENGFM
jgi:riboflavin synthase